MRLRIVLVVAGVLVGLYGALRLLLAGHLVAVLVWLVGGVLLHDGLVAPLTLVALWVGSRILPARARVVVLSSAVVLLTVTVAAVPVLSGQGRRPDNPTLDDRHYVVGWLAFLAILGVVTLARLLPWRRRVPDG